MFKGHCHTHAEKKFTCELCDYKTISNYCLKIHIEEVHDLGEHQCGYCAYNRNKVFEYTCPKWAITSQICRSCHDTASGKTVRKEVEWSNYIDKHFGSEYLLASDRSLKSQGGCQALRPDKLYNCPNLTLVLECDEHQHTYKNGSYTCEERRLSDIYDEPGIAGKFMAVIRYNPDTYQPPEGQKRLVKAERLKLMVDTIRLVTQNYEQVMRSPVHVFYLCFNSDNPKLCKTYPITMVHSKDDLDTQPPDATTEADLDDDDGAPTAA